MFTKFRMGILLGVWDRQVMTSGIIQDDSRNLKALRWTHGGITDTVAFQYLKEEMIKEMLYFYLYRL